MGQTKKTKLVNSIMNFSNGRLSLWRRYCLTRFSCLVEEINEEAQTFIKALGDFLAHAVEVGFFCLLGFTRSTRPRNLKSFSIILTLCTITPNYLSGEESRNWRRSRASHQRKQDWDKCMVAHGGRTFLSSVAP